MSGSHLFYNGVLFRDGELLDFDEVVEQDQSKTDLMFWRIRISFASMLVSLLDGLTPQLPSGLHPSTVWLPSDPGGNVDANVGSIDWTLPDRLRMVMERLQEPRKDFWLAINAATWHDRPGNDEQKAPANNFDGQDPYRTLIAATGLSESQIEQIKQSSEGAVSLGNITAFYQGKETTIDRATVIDANNGPTPISVKPVRIDGGKAIRLHFTIEICLWVKPKPVSAAVPVELPPVRDAGKAKGIISHRWSIKETIDDEWRSNITIEGMLRVSDRRYRADSMRLMTATHLIPYARLSGREFFEASDGLSLSYRYSMIEDGVAPPPATVKWDGTYTEKATNGAITTSTVSAKLIGSTTPPNGWTLRQYKVYLYDMLLKLVQHRVNLTGNLANSVPGQQPKTQLTKDFTITESMRRPEIGINVVIQNTGENMIQGMKLRVNNLIGKTNRVLRAGDQLVDEPSHDPKWWPIPPLYTWDVDSMSGKFGGVLGSAFDQFFQSPNSDWHGKPRGLAVNHPQAGERASDNDTNPVREAIYIYDVKSDPPGLAAVSENDFSRSLFYWSDSQFEGHSYIQVEAENVSSRKTGKMMFPLSKPRGSETVSIIPIHASLQYRVYSAVCSRVGAAPKIPSPKDTIYGPDCIETLADAEITTEPPKPSIDGATVTYTVHCRYKYLINAPSSSVRIPTDPRMNRKTGSDLAVIADIVDATRVI
jgi:hypothetical protein